MNINNKNNKIYHRVCNRHLTNRQVSVRTNIMNSEDEEEWKKDQLNKSVTRQKRLLTTAVHITLFKI